LPQFPKGQSSPPLNIGIFRDLGAAVGRDLQMSHFARHLGRRWTKSLECRKPLRNERCANSGVDAGMASRRRYRTA
jgi:hypothetical protein